MCAEVSKKVSLNIYFYYNCAKNKMLCNYWNRIEINYIDKKKVFVYIVLYGIILYDCKYLRNENVQFSFVFIDILFTYI